MSNLIKKIEVSNGISWVEIPELSLRILCGCPADSVKHLMKRGLILNTEKNGVVFETGPNAILLSDLLIQKGEFCNLAEFPVLQMFYRQGLILPNHPNNKGSKPLLLGTKEQLDAQLNYIYRGNYGLISEEELLEAGEDLDSARELMSIKLKFAFGKIADPKNMFDTIVIDKNQIVIRDSLSLHRTQLNVFEFKYKEESVSVDLNIKKYYKAPYRLGFYNTKKEYFSVIHSGQGDGWDTSGPSMSSILNFQGKTYLIDSGPNLQYTLTALGIGINEIEGIFQTHAHDDHIAGITTLMRSDHRIKFYADPMVRLSVVKKLSALLSLSEEYIYDFFDVRDLKRDVWNDIDGLEVKPLFSPHPVETTIFIFRALGRDSYKTYGHFADIIGLPILEKMIINEKNQIGIEKLKFDEVKENYLTPLDLKKIDIGGGMIHGDIKDFIKDTSSKIVLAHTSLDIIESQKAVGSEAEFGAVDIMIESKEDYIRNHAFDLLKTYFSETPLNQIRLLFNNEVITFNPGTIILKYGTKCKFVYLTLTGIVDSISAEREETKQLSEGSLLGEISCLTDTELDNTYRAISYVRALEIPKDIYISFVKRNGLFGKIEQIKDKIEFLLKTSLFGEKISYLIQNKLASSMKEVYFEKGKPFDFEDAGNLFIIKEGKLNCMIGNECVDTLGVGNYFGEENSVFDTPSLFRFEIMENITAYALPGSLISDIPIVKWKLIEKIDRRKKKLVQISTENQSPFFWRPEYSINVAAMDNHHKKLFVLAEKTYNCIRNNEPPEVLDKEIDYLLEYTIFHFNSEERLLEKNNYDILEDHQKKHAQLINKVIQFKEDFKKGSLHDDDLFVLLRDWILNHIFDEDRRYGKFLNSKGIY